MSRRIAGRVSSLFASRFLRGYARGKLSRDPVYSAAFEWLPEAPLLDVGCGIGLLAFYLRERGFTSPIEGIDHDASKVAAACAAGSAYKNLVFRVGDARATLSFSGNVAILDLLHYFDSPTQAAILGNIARATAPGCVVVIRDAIRDGSWRYRMTYLQEMFSRLIGWLRAERLHFPTAAGLYEQFLDFELMTAVRLSGRTPFNNHLFVFRRPLSGTTNE